MCGLTYENILFVLKKIFIGIKNDLFDSKKKKTIKTFFKIKETFLRQYSKAKICLIQRNFFSIEKTFF